MPNSVIEAIEQGIWDFEPQECPLGEFTSTDALPGSPEKLQILAHRVRRGQPLWHPEDRVIPVVPTSPMPVARGMSRRGVSQID